MMQGEGGVRMRLRWLVGTSVTGLIALGALAGPAPATGPGGWDHVGDGGTAGTPALNGAVYALNADRPGTLYAGGAFTAAGGVAGADRIASWDGSAWSAVSSPSSQIANGAVNAIAYDAATGQVFAGGTFTNAGGDANADFLAVWDGSTWSRFCGGSSHRSPRPSPRSRSSAASSTSRGRSPTVRDRVRRPARRLQPRHRDAVLDGRQRGARVHRRPRRARR